MAVLLWGIEVKSGFRDRLHRYIICQLGSCNLGKELRAWFLTVLPRSKAKEIAWVCIFWRLDSGRWCKVGVAKRFPRFLLPRDASDASRGNVILNALRYAGARTYSEDEWCKHSRGVLRVCSVTTMRGDVSVKQRQSTMARECVDSCVYATHFVSPCHTRKQRYRNFLCSA